MTVGCKPALLIVSSAHQTKRPPGEDPVGVMLVTDNWEEECRQSIGARWEEECAAPNLLRTSYPQASGTPGRAATPVLLDRQDT
ncbi:hypothetical protein EV129_110189 [Rhizobium azibense]|uniref:Uncharacterized protein n=1 Tax=Rhizobium azibense TaxID=1136135 RepID=A0A4R3RKY9_9HYPH|nr:hypothetical protein EV129_110189 [Rhizobium azibense]